MEGAASFLGPEEWRAVALSLRVSVWATAASLPFGILAAYALARWRFPGRQLLNGLVHLPLILPPVATGYILLSVFGTRGPVGGLLAELGVVFAFRWTGAALAAAVMAFPLMVGAMRVAFAGADPRLESAASTLGAGRWRVFESVTLPLAWHGVVAGAVLGFARSIGAGGERRRKRYDGEARTDASEHVRIQARVFLRGASEAPLLVTGWSAPSDGRRRCRRP